MHCEQSPRYAAAGGGQRIAQGMASSAGHITDQLHRAIGSPVVFQLPPARKIFQLTVAAALFVLLGSQWVAVPHEVGRLFFPHNVSTRRPQPLVPAPRRPAARELINTSAPTVAPASNLPNSLLRVREATAAPADKSPQPPLKRRLVLFWTTFWGSSFENFMEQSFPPNLRCD